MNRPTTIVFDLDGTLAHTSPDIAAALNAALAPLGAQVTLAETEQMVGGGVRALLENALALKSLQLPAAEVDAAYTRLLAGYRAAPALRSSLRDWIADVMIEAHGKGARIAVCSNKTEDLVLEILDALAAARWVHAAVGHLPERLKKPDPELLLLAIREAGGDVSRAIMIGDSAADVGAARAVAIPVVLVTGGYGSRDIRTLGADRIVANGQELRAAIVELTSARAA
ncbi:MAG: HAD family hydrolase [Rhodomicrobiaceae bacterium]